MEAVRCADGREVGHVIGQGVADAEGSPAVASDIPSEAGPRAKVMQVEVIDPIECCPEPYETLTGEEIRGPLVGFTQSAIEVPAQSKAESQPRPEFPLVLPIEAEGGLE